MTIEEAIAIIEDVTWNGCGRHYGKIPVAREMAILALEEVQKYIAIGTVEELKAAMKYVSLAKKHGTVGKAIDACAEYEAIGTVSELQEKMNFLEFLCNAIQPNEMEQYLSMYHASGEKGE